MARLRLHTTAALLLPMLAAGIISASAQVAASHPSPTAAQTAAPSVPAASSLPQLVDITKSTGINFSHLSSPEAKYVVESMSGGVALIDYNRDGWPDIYFTNAPSVEMALAGKKARSALYRNNHDGTFTDVSDQAGVATPCWAMGASVGDYNNDGWPDLLVTCFGGVVLYRNNGNGTFTDVTKQAGLGNDTLWAMGAAFGDYDKDGWADLFVDHYVDLNLNDLPDLRLAPHVQISRHRRSMRTPGTEGIARQSLPQQRRRHLHRCFQASRGGRCARIVRTDSSVARLQR